MQVLTDFYNGISRIKHAHVALKDHSARCVYLVLLITRITAEIFLYIYSRLILSPPPRKKKQAPLRYGTGVFKVNLLLQCMSHLCTNY